MDANIITLLVIAAAGVVVGLCIGYYWTSRNTVSAQVFRSLISLIADTARALSDGKITPEERQCIISNISWLVEDIRGEVGGGTVAAAERR